VQLDGTGSETIDGNAQPEGIPSFAIYFRPEVVEVLRFYPISPPTSF
jgi:hypothetical protein